ncbi:MAG: hypothetical protein WA705_12700 [Candidatus Ozemobacteraceae bacterium]
MDLACYRKFTDELIVSLRCRHEVLALIALGSMAETGTFPDAWSDHDFFVITTPGTEEQLRRQLDWLPRHEEIAVSIRETEHGIKVLYQDSHLLEFAVFTPQQLQVASINQFRILFSHLPLDAVLADLATRSADHARAETADPATLLGLFLCNLQVGYGRYQRGEHLSGHLFVKSHAFSQVLRLFHVLGRQVSGARSDNLNPARRFAEAFPGPAVELEAALCLPVPQAAQELLRIVRDSLLSHHPEISLAGIEVLERYLSRPKIPE